MRLHHSPTSPFVRKVVVVLHETGLIGGVTLVAAGGTPTDPGTMPVGLNPLGKIPCLERPDGPALYDSRVICRYLDDLAAERGSGRDGGRDAGRDSGRGGARLYPAPPRLWETLTLEATADGIMEAAVLMVYESRLRPQAARHAPWVEAQWTKIARALDAIESRWMSHLHGPLDCAQIAVGAALGYIDLRHGDRGWRAGRPALAAWEAKFAAREAMVATRPEG